MRRLALLLPGAVGLVCAAYTGIYLVRWEWNRAIIAGIFFVATEVIVASVLVLDRVRRSEQRITTLLLREPGSPTSDAGRSDGVARDATIEALRSTAPRPPDRFAWIRDRSGDMNVFLPVLLGAGVVASALAWLVERVARATVSPALERRLAERLHVLALPPDGFLGPSATTPARPRRSWMLGPAVTVLAVTAGILTAAALDYVADRTQTRPDVRDPRAETFVAVELSGEVAGRDPERVFGHLWSTCTGPDVFRSQRLPDPVVAHRGGGLMHVRVGTDVGDHGLERLRGCLNDTTLDKVQARVVDASVR